MFCGARLGSGCELLWRQQILRSLYPSRATLVPTQASVQRVKGTAIPVQASYRPRGSEEVEVSQLSAHEVGESVSLMHRQPFTGRKYSWYSFLLEAESTPEPYCGRKDYVNENLYRWYWAFLPGVKRPPRGVYQTPEYMTKWLKRTEAIRVPPILCACVACYGTSFVLFFSRLRAQI
jgi:hypothetical protein